MKKNFTLIIILVFAATAMFIHGQKPMPKISKTSTKKIPKEATVFIEFLDLPGIKNTNSKWEMSYELRVIDRKNLFEATKSGKLKSMEIDGEKVGDIVAKGSFKKQNLSQEANRKVSLTIPFDENIREKLESQSQTPHQFLFYASALVFDGKLKKNIVVPLSWVWDYELYPDAKFGMSFKIEDDPTGNAYSRNTFLPAKYPKGYRKVMIPQ